RRDLEKAGYRFHSRSDTEVIVNGWHAWGPRIFSRLRGMFALAIWDQRSRRLVLARDRIGKKPLYYAATADAFLFGSEIKALLAWPELPRTPDLSTIDRYLTWGYVPAPYTAFEGIRKLEAAHYLVVEARADGFVESELVRYWRLPEPRTVRRCRGIADLRHELVGQLEDAVRLRMVSDVPLGAFLSGGGDSSAVGALIARIGGGPNQSFSLVFSARPDHATHYAPIGTPSFAAQPRRFFLQ